MGQIPGKLLVIWDGSPIHRGRAVKEFLASGAASRVQLERLPGYAPDLNPEEGVCKHLKCVELKNLCCQSLAELKIELRKAKKRLEPFSKRMNLSEQRAFSFRPLATKELITEC